LKCIASLLPFLKIPLALMHKYIQLKKK